MRSGRFFVAHPITSGQDTWLIPGAPLEITGRPILSSGGLPASFLCDTGIILIVADWLWRRGDR